MTTMSVPSTLVKCLYLFFDLPHMAEAPTAPATQPPPPPPPPPTATQEKTAGQGHNQQELPLADRRVLLQKVFVQVKLTAVHFVHYTSLFEPVLWENNPRWDCWNSLETLEGTRLTEYSERNERKNAEKRFVKNLFLLARCSPQEDTFKQKQMYRM